MNKITVVKEFTFDAAHKLPNYNGPCQRLHGHAFKLQIGITGVPDAITGMVIDFSFLKNLIQKYVIDFLDHFYLNEVQIRNFPYRLPTAENIVNWVKDVILYNIPDVDGVTELTFIRLYETPTSYAEWRK